MVPNAPTPAFPAGFDAKPGPYGVSFAGGACSEPKLIELAYAFEQASKRGAPAIDALDRAIGTVPRSGRS